MLLPGQANPHVSYGGAMSTTRHILYCYCAYARVVPPEVRSEVLAQLAASGVEFEAVPDLCEMSARRDSRLSELAGSGGLKIAACFPRAVKGLFTAVGAPLPADAEILNMRTETAEQVVRAILPVAEAKS
jgi:hypothetical protein